MYLSLSQDPDNEPRLAGENLFGFFGAKSVATLFFLVFSVVFFAFRSSTLIGDGLRHLPALRTITEHGSTLFKPKPWLEAYRVDYDRVVVHNHFLFALAMRGAFALQQKLCIPGDAIIAMQAVNALSAAAAGGLFFLLAIRVGAPKWISLAVTVGVCLSPAYLLEATNIAEVPLSLPFFLGTLLVLADRELVNQRAVGAGILAGLAAMTYLLAGSLVPGIAVALIASRSFSQSTIRALLLFVSAFTLVFLGIWGSVLFASGVRSPISLFYAVARFPAQGTYGGFKLGSLIATPVGLTEALIPVLPDDFIGLKSLYRYHPIVVLYAGLLSIVICAFLAGAIYLVFHRGMLRKLLFASLLATFLIVEAACIEWDPYYQKLQLFAVILFWVLVAAGFTGYRNSSSHKWLLLVFIGVVALNGLRVLRRNVQPSQPRENAARLYSIIGSGALITGWSSDVAHMWLYTDGSNIIALPDFALARKLQTSRVEEDLDAVIQQTITADRSVYFYGVFDADDTGLANVYEARYRLNGFVAYLRNLQRKARPIAYFKQPGGQQIALYTYTR